jgi:branched-chain amino acid transport system ATP-binding protein
LGANGAGKSTALRTVSGILQPKSGQIEFQGKILNRMAPHQIVKTGISQAPEGRWLFPNLTVRENLSAGQYLQKDPSEKKKDWDEVISWFPILGERMSQIAGTLSGGEQQMLAISRALLTKPALLLLDEPSLGLSPLLVTFIFSAIQRMNAEKGLTILLAEQNVVRALDIAHRGYILELGKIVLEGESKILKENKTVLQSYVGTVSLGKGSSC